MSTMNTKKAQLMLFQQKDEPKIQLKIDVSGRDVIIVRKNLTEYLGLLIDRITMQVLNQNQKKLTVVQCCLYCVTAQSESRFSRKVSKNGIATPTSHKSASQLPFPQICMWHFYFQSYYLYLSTLVIQWVPSSERKISQRRNNSEEKNSTH